MQHRGPVGLNNGPSKEKTEIDHFFLFITHEILADVQHQISIHYFKYLFVKEVNEMELKNLIGLFLYRGLCKLNIMGIRKLFSDSYRPPTFSAAMSRNRFTFILHNLSFDDESTHAERWKKNMFTVNRESFEKFNNQCMVVLAPGDYLSLDETLYLIRTPISFKHFNPSQPAK